MPSSIVSVSQAADLVRKDRQTLYNHNKLGKLSFVRREDNSYGVDTAELQRMYGKLYVTAKELDSNIESAEIVDIRHQLAMRDLELRNEKERAHDLEQSRDEWKQQAKEATSSMKLLEQQSNEKSAEWKQALYERQSEIKQARLEADEIRQREERQGGELMRVSSQLEALQSRGFIARLFNKKSEVAG